MLHEFSRTELLIGSDNLVKLRQSKVAIFGIGGVGSYVAEGLARSGVGEFFLVDDDNICLTNINRQLHATHSSVGKPKVEVMRDRILDINPHAKVEIIQKFYLPENAKDIIQESFDYIVDAIDTVTAKLDLIEKNKIMNIPIISCMGTGNKMNPTELEITDITITSVCPLARIMRQELKKRGIHQLKVVYSKEAALTPIENEISNCSNNCICPKNSPRTCTKRRQIPGSNSFVPSVAGLIIASEVIKDLINWNTL